MITWKDDFDYLRKFIKDVETSNPTWYVPLLRTLLYVLISHMRGRIHMHSYLRYKGGWNTGHIDKKTVDSASPCAKMVAAYGTWAKLYEVRSEINTLEDQAEWLRKYSHGVLLDVVERVLKNAYPYVPAHVTEPKKSPQKEGVVKRILRRVGLLA